MFTHKFSRKRTKKMCHVASVVVRLGVEVMYYVANIVVHNLLPTCGVVRRDTMGAIGSSHGGQPGSRSRKWSNLIDWVAVAL
jgi:hypothetical protein